MNYLDKHNNAKTDLLSYLNASLQHPQTPLPRPLSIILMTKIVAVHHEPVQLILTELIKDPGLSSVRLLRNMRCS